jgi:hypothetical protein
MTNLDALPGAGRGAVTMTNFDALPVASRVAVRMTDLDALPVASRVMGQDDSRQDVKAAEPIGWLPSLFQ